MEREKSHIDKESKNPIVSNIVFRSNTRPCNACVKDSYPTRSCGNTSSDLFWIDNPLAHPKIFGIRVMVFHCFAEDQEHPS